MGVMELVFGDLNKKEVKKLEKIADKVEAYDEAMQALTDDELRAKTKEFQDRCQNKGESLDSLLPEAFAVCREAAWRVLGMKHCLLYTSCCRSSGNLFSVSVYSGGNCNEGFFD